MPPQPHVLQFPVNLQLETFNLKLPIYSGQKIGITTIKTTRIMIVKGIPTFI